MFIFSYTTTCISRSHARKKLSILKCSKEAKNSIMKVCSDNLKKVQEEEKWKDHKGGGEGGFNSPPQLFHKIKDRCYPFPKRILANQIPRIKETFIAPKKDQKLHITTSAACLLINYGVKSSKLLTLLIYQGCGVIIYLSQRLIPRPFFTYQFSTLRTRHPSTIYKANQNKRRNSQNRSDTSWTTKKVQKSKSEPTQY